MSLETAEVARYTPFTEIAKEYPVESGLDLLPTLEWTKANKTTLNELLTSRLNVQNADKTDLIIKPNENPDLDPIFVAKVINLVPEGLRSLSRLDEIQGRPSLWFHKDSLKGEIQPTTDVTEAISPTSIPTGSTSDHDDSPFLTVSIYKIPDIVTTDPVIKELLLASTILHEYLHTITWPMLMDDSIKIRLGNGEEFSGSAFLHQFGIAAEKHSPISHYSSAHRNESGLFKADNEGNKSAAIEEEFIECLTTQVLGFSLGSLTDISGDPFADRPDIRDLCKSFIEAVPTTEFVRPKD